MTAPKHIAPRTESGFVLVGPYGNIWHDRLFKSEADAFGYLREYWRSGDRNWTEWRILPAVQTLEIVETVTQAEGKTAAEVVPA